MSWRQHSLIVGGIGGGVGVTITLLLLAVFGATVGGVLGVVAGAACGALGGFAGAFTVRDTIRIALTGLTEFDVSLPLQTPAQVHDAELDPLLEAVQGSLHKARLALASQSEVERTAQTLWTAVQGQPGPAPDAKACVAGLCDLFRQTAESLRRYATTLEEANERMASGALDQSETVSRTATTVEALSEKIERISQNAESATAACERARLEARRGLEQVHQVIEGMDRLRAQIEINGRKARRLGDRSVEIGTIVEMIRGISSRTDMLALNATIESVRAGEHGRGFAVVAEEIRKLSERTAAATRDIGTLVEAIQADTHETIRALGVEQTEMEQEAQRVRETGVALERITQVSEQSAQLVDGISRSSNDQVVAAQELVRSMQRITDVSHLTLERTAQSRESLRGLAQWCEKFAPLIAPVSNPPAAPAEKPFDDGPGIGGSRRIKRRGSSSARIVR